MEKRRETEDKLEGGISDIVQHVAEEAVLVRTWKKTCQAHKPVEAACKRLWTRGGRLGIRKEEQEPKKNDGKS